ncbi:MAG: efflux RND transporter periplasmic adaptor subunit [Vulcanimicrobiaceae bacterium]
MSASIRGRIIVALTALVILAALALAFMPRPQQVDIGLVSRGAMRVSLEAEGKTRVRERYVVDAPVDGRVGRVALREGNPVVAGELLAEIDPLPLRASIDETLAHIDEARAERSGVVTQVPKPAALTQARDRIVAAEEAARTAAAQLAQAQASRTQAQRDRNRAAALAASGDIARSQLEAANLAAVLRERDVEVCAHQARAAQVDGAAARAALAELEARREDPRYLYGVYDAQIRAAEASLRSLRHDAVQTDVRAPVSGRVLRILQKSEANVKAGAPIVEVGNVRALEMIIDVLSPDAVGILPGAEVRVVEGAERELRGRVRYVEPSAFTKVSALGVEEQRVNVIADFIDPPGRLGDLYRIETDIELWSAGDATQVPIDALFRCSDRWCAYVVAGARALRRTVSIGHTNDEVAEVLGGLERGDRVILHPSDSIDDGTRVGP